MNIDAPNLDELAKTFYNNFEAAINNADIIAVRKFLFTVIDIIEPTRKDIHGKLTEIGLADLMTKGFEAVNAWANDLKCDDIVEVYSEAENGWFESKIIQRDGDRIKVHYQGWDSKFDTWLEISKTLLNPIYVFCKPKVNKKIKLETNQPVIEEVLNNEEQVNEAEEPQVVSKSGRVIKNSSVAAAPQKKAKTTETDKNDWICGICHFMETQDGTDLILCDGICRRSFHVGCLENVEDGHPLPDLEADDDQNWFCIECTQGRHTCFVCGIVGQDHKEVAKCGQGNCGKFYHRECISGADGRFLPTKISEIMREVLKSGKPMAVKEAQKNGAATSAGKKKKGTKRKVDEGEPDPVMLSAAEEVGGEEVIKVHSFTFKCPHHMCDTCFEFYGSSHKELRSELAKCIKCPRSFHAHCIPPGSRFNSMCLLCPRHPNDTLPTQHLVTNCDRKSLVNQQYLQFWDEMFIPDLVPDANNPLDNHFKLPMSIKDEIENTPKNFKVIRANDYSTLPYSPPSTYMPDQPCECVDVCDERCMNRILRVECSDSKICRVGAHCGNRRLQEREYASVEVFKEHNMGFGLRAAAFTPRGALVIEYMGEIIDLPEVRRRMGEQGRLAPTDKDFYIMELDSGMYVDGKLKGNLSRFINHSCDPNCELQRWVVKGQMRIAIVAIKDIQKNEPLSYDYQFDTSDAETFKCYCGAADCRGTMAPRKKGQLTAASLTGEEKKRLIALAKRYEKLESRIEDERSRSYTGRYLPGDLLNEVKAGPLKTTLALGKAVHLFAARNLKIGSNFVSRYEAYRRQQQQG